MSILYSTCNTTYESNKTTFAINEDFNSFDCDSSILIFLFCLIKKNTNENINAKNKV